MKGRTDFDFFLEEAVHKTPGLQSKVFAQVIHEPLRRIPVQLFQQRLSHKIVKAYATMLIGIMGSKSLALFD